MVMPACPLSFAFHKDYLAIVLGFDHQRRADRLLMFRMLHCIVFGLSIMTCYL